MMGVCGQRAVLGLNLTKLLRGVAQKAGDCSGGMTEVAATIGLPADRQSWRRWR